MSNAGALRREAFGRIVAAEERDAGEGYDAADAVAQAYLDHQRVVESLRKQDEAYRREAESLATTSFGGLMTSEKPPSELALTYAAALEAHDVEAKTKQAVYEMLLAADHP